MIEDSLKEYIWRLLTHLTHQTRVTSGEANGIRAMDKRPLHTWLAPECQDAAEWELRDLDRGIIDD